MEEENTLQAKKRECFPTLRLYVFRVISSANYKKHDGYELSAYVNSYFQSCVFEVLILHDRLGQLRYRYGEFLLTLEPMYRRYYCVLRWSIQTNETVGVLESE